MRSKAIEYNSMTQELLARLEVAEADRTAALETAVQKGQLNLHHSLP